MTQPLQDEDEDPAEVERAWDDEILRRVAELEAGTAELIPAEEVFAELRVRSRRFAAAGGDDEPA
ncbi:addiction module protein [Longimicrobium sp.]|uniref:addiction module protein n=1 Tax=Longimicrobium sp. TaxID=2029185 RepID=UPI002CD0FE63|nr:addiction module protein [Longimicrobium sp.]HSU14376.1 addiction module protein [Longimicrobium sp.]